MFDDAEFGNFDEAAGAVLEFLRDRYGFGVWMVTRVKQNRWLVLRSGSNAYGISAGHEFKWSDSICSRMVRDQGPRIAPRVFDIPDYLEAPLRERLNIKSYMGVPLRAANGKFFGTLCGIDQIEHPEIEDSELPLLEILAALLAGYIRSELANNDLERRNERFRFEAMTDALTHLPNRRAWEEKIGNEQTRSVRMGDTTFISAIDLNELEEINDRDGPAAGDELLRKTALALRYAVRNADFVARVAGDEFAVLGIQCDSIEPEAVSERLRTSLAQVGISASVGTAASRPADSLSAVWSNADAAMYADQKTGDRTD